MNEYLIPEEYYFRIHHVRPRFKGDLENVLIYIAEELVSIGPKSTDEFVEELNNAISRYPGNSCRELKTINNWRTEITSLFGFIEHCDGVEVPGKRAQELAEKQDLVEFFKCFLYCFQYPGAHIKSQEILKQIEAGIHFKPAQYILKVLKYACAKEKRNIGLTKYEICHCIFNDLRCTRDNEAPDKVWNRIKQNRNNNVIYDQAGDVVRYAGDIVDYMEIANLLVTYDNRTFYLNTLEAETVLKFTESTEWFNMYDEMIEQRSGSMERIKACFAGWFSYVNRDMSSTDFSTDLLAYIAKNNEELSRLKERTEIVNTLIDKRSIPSEKAGIEIDNRLKNEADNLGTKDIGDIGESLVHSHECMRIKMGGREDLIHLIKRIPTQFAVGYDISSVELDERKRFIEVKTTISSRPLHFNKVHLTKNEWNTANSTRDRYFVYRLMISKFEKTLYILQDPVGLYKKDLIDMIPCDGADITFNPKEVGQFEELLSWKS